MRPVNEALRALASGSASQLKTFSTMFEGVVVVLLVTLGDDVLGHVGCRILSPFCRPG